jgi:hypothetical protein
MEELAEDQLPGTETEGGEGNPETEEPETVEPEKKLEFTQAQLDAMIQKAKAKAERKAVQRVEREYSRQQPQAEYKPDRSAEPKRMDFENDAEWIDAKIEYRELVRERQFSNRELERQQENLVQKTEAFYDDAEDQPGFDRDVFDSLVITDVMAQAILESDNAAKLAEYMSMNPTAADQIHKLSPVKQVAAMLKLESKLEKQTKEPQPQMTTVRGGGVTPMPDITKMNEQEYRAYRAKQGAWWAK